jgi:hypothetical protein
LLTRRQSTVNESVKKPRAAVRLASFPPGGRSVGGLRHGAPTGAVIDGDIGLERDNKAVQTRDPPAGNAAIEVRKSMDKSAFMRRAIALAREGSMAGHGGPFGCVIVKVSTAC